MAFNLTSGQWYTAKYRYSYTGESGTARIAEIHEDGYNNTVSGVTTIVASGRGSVATRYEVEGDDEYAPFRPSTTTLSFFDTNGALVADLLAQLNDVANKYAIVLREGNTLDWVGLVEPQNIDINEQGPIAIKIEATCGLKRRLDEAPYIDDPSATYTVNEGPITLVSAVAKMLGPLGYGLDFYVAGTIKPRATTFTALGGDEKCPLQFIWTNELAFTSGTENEYGVISNKAALKSILEAFGMSIVQSGGAWHLTQTNLRHGGTYRRWAFDSDGIPVDLGGGNNFETFEHRVTITDEDLESTLTRARFARAYSSVVTQYQHGKVRYVRRPGFQVGTMQEAENFFAGDNPWVTSGTASIRPFINDDLACRIDAIDGNISGTTGYADVIETTDQYDIIYGNADDSLSAFTTLVDGNTVSQETSTVYAGTTLRFFSSMYCDAISRRPDRPELVLFQLKHNGDNKYAYFKTDGSLGWQSTANWCVLRNMAQKDNWTLSQNDFSDATATDGTVTITMGPLFEDQSGYDITEQPGFGYLWWDNVDLKPILGAGEKDTEATSVVNFVNGARTNPYPRTVVMHLGDGPSAANRTCLFTDITLSTVTGNWEQTTAAHGDTATGESLARIVGAAMLKSMNQFRRVRSGGYPGRGDVLTPLQTINSGGDLYVPLELDVNWSTEITGGSWYLANEQAFTSDLVEGISTGFSGFTNRGNGQSSSSGAFMNRIGSSFDTLLARESDRLATVSADATSGTTVSCTALAYALKAGDPVFFQNKKTGYIMKRVVAADAAAAATSFTVTVAFSASEPINNGDPVLPGSISGLRIDMSGVQIVNTHLKNDGLNAWDGTVDATGAITAAGTQGWIITRTGEAEFNDVTVRGKIVVGSGSSGIATFTDAGAAVAWDTADDVVNGASKRVTTNNEATGGSRAYSGLDSSANLVTSVIPASNVGSPGSAGLYLGADYMGYHTGSGLVTGWKTYMDSSGNFYLGGTSGRLQWNGSTLAIDGAVTISAASGFSGSGYLQIGSGTKDSTLNGFNFDSSEIVGQASGVDQVVLNTNGQIVAGGGKVTLDADGITVNAASGSSSMKFQVGGADNLAIEAGSTGGFDYTFFNANDYLILNANDPGAVYGTAQVVLSTGEILGDTTPSVTISGAHLKLEKGTYGLERVAAANTADVTVTNSVTETTVITSTVGADGMKAGDVVRVWASGTYGHTTSPASSMTLKVKIGGTTVATEQFYFPTGSGSSGFGWEAEFFITLRSATSALGSGRVVFEKSNLAGDQVQMCNTGPTTISSVTTNNLAVAMTMTWDVANASNTITAKAASISIQQQYTVS